MPNFFVDDLAEPPGSKLGKGASYPFVNTMETRVPSTERVFIGLGTNLGDLKAQIKHALLALEASPGVQVVATSGLYESEALVKPGSPEQPRYLNAVTELETRLSPLSLLDVLERIEYAAGREPASKASWAPRPLDLDLLAFGEQLWHDERLTVPHLELASRRFVLAPWAEIAPDFMVPAPHDRTVRDLLCACPDQLEIHRLSDGA